MKKRLLHGLLSTLAAAACLATASGAAIETYNSSSAWTTAGGQTGMVTFTGITNGTIIGGYSSGPLSFAGSPSGNLFGSQTPASWRDLGQEAIMLGPNGGPANFLRIGLSGTLYGIGLLVATEGNPGDSLRFVVNGNASYDWTLPTTAPLPSANPTFFGVRADFQITTLDVYTINTGTRLVLDSVQYSNTPYEPPAETPEASTMILIGSGLLCMRWLKKRHHFADGMSA